jgi:hypothetical protein
MSFLLAKKIEIAGLTATPELSSRGLQAQRSAASSDHWRRRAGATSMVGILLAIIALKRSSARPWAVKKMSMEMCR